jgi:hypothetical protein
VAVWYRGPHYVFQLTVLQFGIADRFIYCRLQWQFGIADRFIHCRLQCQFGMADSLCSAAYSVAKW